MSKLFYLVGLPASGKSTLALNLRKEFDAVIISSDSLREELYGDINDVDHNAEVFNEMLKRTKDYLNKGINVIYDATNINSKKRKGFLGQFKNFEKICYYVSESNLNSLYYRNAIRDRKVPVEVISKMYRNLQIPMYHEGWDKINIIRFPNEYIDCDIDERECIETLIKDDSISYDDLFNSLISLFNDFRAIYNLPQDSSYHTLSVSRHTYYVYDYIRKNYNKYDKLVMLWSALLHDIGKAYCKNFKENSRYANFIGHENVSSQKAIEILHQLGYDDEFILKVVTIVQLHMRLMNTENHKLLNVVGEDLYLKLGIFNEADKTAK